jgi:hypothetical protein
VPECLQDFAAGTHHIGFIADVGPDGQHTERIGGLLQLRFVAAGDRHARAGADEHFRNGAADAAASTGDQGVESWRFISRSYPAAACC